MADIKDILSASLKAGDAADAIDKYTESLEKLAQVKASSKGDLKAIRNAEKMATVIKNLKNVTEDLQKAEEAYKQAALDTTEEGIKNAEQKKKLVYELMDIKEKENAQLLGYAKAVSDRHDILMKQALEEKEAIMTRWKQNTLLGKSYSALSGPVAKWVAGITAGGLALKALNRFTDAAKLRNDMMIASYRELDDSIGSALSGTMDYESAIRQAESAAIRYGMANENVADMMIRYQRIVGESTPEALGALTESTLAMAKVMGISGAQALDYVQARLDNFGGTAADALKSLDDLREGTVKYNTTLHGVRIRGDDVVRTIQDITNSNGVYAVDQRFLSQVLMRTSATLQSQGESYNFAQKQAENYSKALTSEAPEWMQITNAFDITKNVMSKENMTTSADGVRALTKTYAAELDKAKPGLSKKVTDLLNAGYNEYDVTRLLGEALKDTEIGMKSMSKKIVELGSSSISTLAAVYGKTYTEAEVMYQTALKQNKLEEQKIRLMGGTVEQQKENNKEIAAALGLNEETVKNSRDQEGQYEKLLDMYAEKQAMDEIAANNIERQDAAAGEVQRITAEIASLNELIAEQENNKNAEGAKISKDRLADLQKELDQQQAIATKDTTGSKSILGALTAKVDKFQEATGMFTGNWFKAKFNDFSSPQILAIGSVSLLLLRGLGWQSKATKFLEKIAYNTARGGIDGGDSGSGRGGKSNRRQRRYEASKGIKSKGVGGFRGIKGAAKGLIGKTGSLLKKAGGFKGLLKKIPGVGLGMAALDAGSAYADSGAKGATKSLIGSSGGAVGSVAGAALGSIVPVVGTAVGGLVGGLVGDALGGIAANMYDKFTSSPDQIGAHLGKTTTVAPTSATSTSSTGPMPGLGGGSPTGDLGKLNPDGSITLTITNFMDGFVQSMGMAKQNGIKP